MMHWALFAKSPNWASQITRAFGEEREYPYSKPRLNELAVPLSVEHLHSVFAKRRIGNDKTRLILAHVLQRGVRVLRLLIVENGMSLREGSALHILAGNSDVVA